MNLRRNLNFQIVFQQINHSYQLLNIFYETSQLDFPTKQTKKSFKKIG